MQHLTTPFGRRSLTAAQIHAQTNAAACPDGTTVDKWSVLRDIATSRGELGLGDRAIAILSALVSFHPGDELKTGVGARPIVFPSNVQIRNRAHGMAEATLRHHLGMLVEAGIVIRRDSPNGKRYARKGEGGVIVDAFGFDLTPLASRAPEFRAAADRIAAADRVARLARERVSLLRRDLRKLIEWAVEAGAPGPWERLSVELASLVATFPRRPLGDALAGMRIALEGLLNEAHKYLDQAFESKISDGNDAATERHHQNSNTDAPEFEEAVDKRGEETRGVRIRPAATPSFPLPMVLEACPDIVDYARHGIRRWSDLVDAAELARGLLGISASAWLTAKDTMGAETAAVTIAAILQRSENIRSPGGYLRSLVERKRAGLFSLGPLLQALLRSKPIGLEPLPVRSNGPASAPGIRVSRNGRG